MNANKLLAVDRGWQHEMNAVYINILKHYELWS